MENTVWTREMVEALKVGDVVRLHLGNGHYMAPRRVVEIIYQGISDSGAAYKGFYTEFGDKAIMSGSVREGESQYQLLSEEDIRECHCRPTVEGDGPLCVACQYTLAHSGDNPREPYPYEFPSQWANEDPGA